MKRLTIMYLDHAPPVPEDLAPNVVEVYVGTSGDKIEMYIARRGFVAADSVMDAITNRIHKLDVVPVRSGKSVAERVGLYPVINSKWRKFLDDLLQRDDAWAFLVPVSCAIAAS